MEPTGNLTSGPWTLLTPLVILGTAVFAWLYHRNISAKRAVIEFCSKAELGNSEWVSGKPKFGELTNNWSNSLARKQEPEDASVIVSYLNHCELVAIAIQENAMHEEMYKLFRRTAYIRTWSLAKAYIKERRQTHKTLYENFQRLAEKWESEAN